MERHLAERSMSSLRKLIPVGPLVLSLNKGLSWSVNGDHQGGIHKVALERLQWSCLPLPKHIQNVIVTM